MQKSSVQEEKQYSWIIFKVFKWPHLKQSNQEIQCKLADFRRMLMKVDNNMSFDSLDFHELKLSKVM